MGSPSSWRRAEQRSNPYFVGRADELRHVAKALESRRCVVVWGAPGLGKSALASECAHRGSWRYPGGVLWLSCQGNPAFDTLLNQMGAFCGVDVSGIDPGQKEAQVRALLAGLKEECLLVWDNFEDVLGGEHGDSILSFLQRLPPNCRALVTSRENPDVHGWGAAPLPKPPNRAMQQLFWTMARDRNIQIHKQQDLDALAKLLRFLEGHPLALTLVAPLAETRRLQHIWHDLRAQPLEEVEASLALSYNALSEEQQALFTRLSVFNIPFDEDAAGAVGQFAHALRHLQTLVRRSLIGFDGLRYSYHSLIRQYARARLAEREDPRLIHRRAAEYLREKFSDQEQAARRRRF